MKMHFAPNAPFSWPNPSQGPRMRTFHLGDGIVCPASRNYDAPSTSNEGAVTCERCRRIMKIGRYDSQETVRKVLSRGLNVEMPATNAARKP